MQDEPKARIVVPVATVAYLLLFLGGVLWLWGQGRKPCAEGALAPLRVFRDAGVGVAAAGLLSLLSALLSRRARWVRRLEREFKLLLGPLTAGEILVLALLSGGVEEFFFRGAMQPVLGLAGTSLLFGLLHVGPKRAFLPWTAFAVAMGFFLGFLYEATGSLVAPAAVHVCVNLVSLARINSISLDPADP